MLQYFFKRNKTVKVLRRKAGLTAKELAILLGCETNAVLINDDKSLKEVDEQIRKKMWRILR